MEKGNDYGKQFEIDKGRKHDGNVVELVEKKKRKRKKANSVGSGYHVREEDFEDAKGGRMKMGRAWKN